MGMSPRLLRPRQTIHPEAASWAARVVANGGTVGTSLSAVSKFCRAIDAAGIRDRFFRLNLFCGGTSGTAVGVKSAMVPLYISRSFGGTSYGFNVDDNVGGLFVGGDYNETGSSGGLIGGGTRYLNTGLASNVLTAGDRHLSAYETVRSGGTFQCFLGTDEAGSQRFVLEYGNNASVVSFGYGAFSANLNSSAVSTGGHWIGSNTPAGTGQIYRNGSADTSATQTAQTLSSRNLWVYAINRSDSPTNYYAGRLGSYSIGGAMTATQAAAYYAALQAFQTALGRNA